MEWRRTRLASTRPAMEDWPDLWLSVHSISDMAYATLIGGLLSEWELCFSNDGDDNDDEYAVNTSITVKTNRHPCFKRFLFPTLALVPLLRILKGDDDFLSCSLMLSWGFRRLAIVAERKWRS